jgi:hypothetical protein
LSFPDCITGIAGGPGDDAQIFKGQVGQSLLSVAKSYLIANDVFKVTESMRFFRNHVIGFHAQGDGLLPIDFHCDIFFMSDSFFLGQCHRNMNCLPGSTSSVLGGEVVEIDLTGPEEEDVSASDILAFCVICQDKTDIRGLGVFSCGHACVCLACFSRSGSTIPYDLRTTCPLCRKSATFAPLNVSISIGTDLRCQKCGRGDHEDTMLLCDCDSCGKGWHMDCLPKTLTKVPKGLWFCPMHG